MRSGTGSVVAVASIARVGRGSAYPAPGVGAAGALHDPGANPEWNCGKSPSPNPKSPPPSHPLERVKGDHVLFGVALRE
jgi:hypothetical protein